MTPVRSFICICMLISLFTGCKKEENEDAPDSLPASFPLVGSWEIKKTYGGFFPEKAYAAGNGNMLKFTLNAYQKYTDSVLVKSGSYTLAVDTLVINTLPVAVYKVLHKITFDNDSVNSHQLEITDSTFIFDYGSSMVDGTETLYRRIK